jgi:Asp-tRNA(Asn)/Glu-tRNA(Gln) amidotransferase B subunit
MKWLIAIVIAVILMALAGWLTFSKSGDRAAINVETRQIKEDAGKAVEKGKEFSEDAGRKGRELLKDAKD